MSEKRKPKKIIPSKAPTVTAKPGAVVTIPDSESILAEALQVVAHEVTMYRARTTRGGALDPKSARILQGYVKCLVDVSKEMREMNKEMNYDELSDEELAKLVKKLTKGSDDE